MNSVREDIMMRQNLLKLTLLTTTTVLLTCGQVLAQDTSVQGLITGRSGATMTVQSQTSGAVTVLLSAATQVDEVEGVFHARAKPIVMTALVPGLPVQVKGTFNAQNQLIANSVKFKGSDLKTAQDIQAGLQPTEQAVQANAKQIKESEAQIQAQQQQLQEQEQQQEADETKIAANKAAIVAANKRFGELADYNILGEVTVYFGNGKVAIDPQFKPQLTKLSEQAKGITAYVLQVKGYASSVGSAALNQRLSAERAQNVTSYLEQRCAIPLTNMLAPGAMGTSRQVASDKTAEGQAENRRVVVRILQNKGIAGT
jgi:outer membrane protein OmpA-like peptidoglycan-associated protein